MNVFHRSVVIIFRGEVSNTVVESSLTPVITDGIRSTLKSTLCPSSVVYFSLGLTFSPQGRHKPDDWLNYCIMGGDKIVKLLFCRMKKSIQGEIDH